MTPFYHDRDACFVKCIIPSYFDYGRLLQNQKQPADALAWYAKAALLLEGNLTRGMHVASDRLILRNTHWSRAEALNDLRRHAEAVKDWDRAIELVDGPTRPMFRLLRAMTLAQVGDHAQAIAEAETQAAGQNVPVGTLYDCACVFSRCSAGCKDDAGRQKQYADRAMALLTKAAGYNDSALAAHLKTDDDLAALRDRADYQALVAGLEKAKPPKREAAPPRK